MSIFATFGAPIRDKNNNIFGVVLTFLNLTEKRRIEQMLIQSEKMASIGTLASSVAHKINNPTGYIYSNLKTLESYAKKFKTFCSFVQKIIDDYSKAKDDKTRELS